MKLTRESRSMELLMGGAGSGVGKVAGGAGF